MIYDICDMKRFFILICSLLALVACSDKDYDVSQGVSKEITLFEDEISAPVGSLGPVTIGSTLSGLSMIEGIGGLVAQYIKADDEGNLVLEDSGDIFRQNVYEIEKNMGDVSAPQTWNAGYQSGFIGGMAAALGFMGLKVNNQQLTVTATNPLFVDVHASCGATYGCMGTDGYFSAPIEVLDNVNIEKGKTVEVASVAIPENITSPLTAITFSNLAMDLPANPVSNLYSRTGNLFFAFTYNYKCGIATGETLNMPVNDLSTGRINLEIGKYRLKKCQVKVSIENTIPLAVSVNNIRVLKPRESKNEEAVVNEDIVISSGITVAGGSIENPSTTDITLSIEALSGTIPDIPELMLNLNLAAQPGMGNVPLSAKQGLYIKSSSVKLTGGITLGRNE